MTDTAQSLHEAIQRSLNAGDFEKIRELSDALGQAIICEAQAVPLSDRRVFVEQGLSRLSDHLNLARVLRAHVVTRLRENTTLSLYQQAGYQQAGQRGNSWQFDA